MPKRNIARPLSHQPIHEGGKKGDDAQAVREDGNRLMSFFSSSQKKKEEPALVVAVCKEEKDGALPSAVRGNRRSWEEAVLGRLEKKEESGAG